MPRVVASWSSGDALGVVDHSETCKPCGPPPSLRSATAVLAAARGKDAQWDAATRGGRSAKRFTERGARDEPPGEESAASGLPRGGLGSPRSLMARWRHGIESDLGPTAARSEVNQRLWGSCDMGLLESRSPRRDASADRTWRWPVGLSEKETEGLHRGHRRTDNPAPNRGDKSLEGRTKYDGKNYHPRKGDAASRQRRKRVRYARFLKETTEGKARPRPSPKTRPFSIPFPARGEPEKSTAERHRPSIDQALPASAFLELASPMRVGSCQCVLELEDASGAKMRVHLQGAESPDLTALSRSFWDRGR